MFRITAHLQSMPHRYEHLLTPLNPHIQLHVKSSAEPHVSTALQFPCNTATSTKIGGNSLQEAEMLETPANTHADNRRPAAQV